jgi:lipopolysaccharide export system protein LptC
MTLPADIFMAHDNSYSRIVAFLKVLFPLAALVLLSLIFLISRNIDPTQAIALSEVDVEELAREPRISSANYAGVTNDGAAFTVQALTARANPEGGFRLDLTEMSAVLETIDGLRTEFRSDHGDIDQVRGTMQFLGNVEINASPGYTLHVPQLTARLDRTGLVATGGITAIGPGGDITSDQFALRPSFEVEDAYVLVFSGNVKLIYTPLE